MGSKHTKVREVYTDEAPPIQVLDAINLIEVLNFIKGLVIF